MNKISWTFITIVIMYGCKTEEINPPSENNIYFKGVTITDFLGGILSSDTTDWRTDDTWSMKESDLFSSIYQTMCSPLDTNKIIAYPNPCNGTFALHIEKELASRIELRLIDQDYNILISNDNILQNNVQINAGTFGIHDTVRLYYKFVDGNREFKGHGDIIIQ